MKILIVCGTYPPKLCGVGDYTYKLIQTLNLRSDVIDVKVLSNLDWSIFNLSKIVSAIKKEKPDFIHIQFPSAGYKNSLVPQLLIFVFPSIVTVHEVSQFHPLKKLSLMPFSIKASLIFTNEYEQRYFKKIFPWHNSKSSVIPIGSNIDGDVINSQIHRNLNHIVYFGQIRPKKGIEDVVELANLIVKYKLNYKVIVAGQVLERYKDYFTELQNLSGSLYVDWQLNRSEEEVNVILSSNLIAYLPFPDGASERRGSLFAVLDRRMYVFTTHGKQTPNQLDEIVTYVNSPLEVVGIIQKNQDLYANYKTQQVEGFIKQYSWQVIVDKHIELYKKKYENCVGS